MAFQGMGIFFEIHLNAATGKSKRRKDKILKIKIYARKGADTISILRMFIKINIIL